MIGLGFMSKQFSFNQNLSKTISQDLLIEQKTIDSNKISLKNIIKSTDKTHTSPN